MSYMPLNNRSEVEYEARNSADLEKDGGSRHPQTPRTLQNLRMVTAIKYTAIVLLLIGSFALGRTTSDAGKTPVNGSTIEPVSLGKCPPDWKEAKEEGCMYDLVLSTWMHPGCFNVEVYERYKGILRDMDFTYWLEPEMVHEVSLEVVESGEHGWVWTDGRFHHLHCAYVMDRIYAASKKGTTVLDTLCRSDGHIAHCLQYNGNPDWEDVKALNTTRIYNEDYLVDCLVG